jgi:hypothetical protein
MDVGDRPKLEAGSTIATSGHTQTPLQQTSPMPQPDQRMDMDSEQDPVAGPTIATQNHTQNLFGSTVTIQPIQPAPTSQPATMTMQPDQRMHMDGRREVAGSTIDALGSSRHPDVMYTPPFPPSHPAPASMLPRVHAFGISPPLPYHTSPEDTYQMLLEQSA